MTDEGMVAFVLEQLSDPTVSARHMFGGHGIYRNGRMFGLVYDEAIYMKITDDEAKTSRRLAPDLSPSMTDRSSR